MVCVIRYEVHMRAPQKQQCCCEWCRKNTKVVNLYGQDEINKFGFRGRVYVLCIPDCIPGPPDIAMPYGLTCCPPKPDGSCIVFKNWPIP